VVAACASGTDTVTTADVASVSITPPSTTVSIGAQVPLEARTQDPTGRTITGTSVFWSVQNPSIATISSAGVVTGMALGSTQVAASVNGKSAIAAITVQRVPVSSVVVTPPRVDAAPGVQTQLAATAYDAAQNPLSGRAITWSTSSAAVAAVDTSGMMTTVSTGSATITATAEGKSGTATITVTQAAVATVSIAPSPLSMSVGQQTQLAATLKDASGNVLNGRTVTWSSSNTGVATVSADGVLSAVAAGTTTITATCEGKSGTAAVTISNVAVGSVTVLPQGPSIFQSTNLQLSATVRDANDNIVTDRVVTWSTSNLAQATVSSTGIVTGVAPGTVVITATSEGKSGTTSVTVAQVPVGSVTVAPASASIRVTKTVALTAAVRDSLGNPVNRGVTWSSINPAIATVSAGVVTGVAIGTATITATSEGKSGGATITVTGIPVATVVVSPATKAMLMTQTVSLGVTVTDSAGNVVTDRAVTWASSNAAVATVSSSGVATAVAPGTATVTATSEGKSGSATLTVSAVPVSTVAITPASPDTVFVSYTTKLTAVTKDSAGNVLTGRAVTWQSNKPSVATIDSTGVVSGVTAGTATITATSEGKNGANTIVSVKAPVGSVTIAPKGDSLTTTGSVAIGATVKDVRGTVVTDRVVSWASTAGAVASVAPATGGGTTVTAKSVGSTLVIASSETKADTASVTIIRAVTSVQVAPASATLSVAGIAPRSSTAQLTATAVNGPTVVTGRTITWKSSNTAIATVSASGLVTAKAVGTATITATAVLDNVTSPGVAITVVP
jgi:uncharacterized protein YjdB